MELIKLGDITDRTDVVKELEKHGTVNRLGKKYITIIPEGTKKKVRLKGPIYEDDFNAGLFQEYGPEPGRSKEETGREREAGIAEARQRMEAALGKRTEFYHKRYGIEVEETRAPGQSPEYEQPDPARGFGNSDPGGAGQPGMDLEPTPAGQEDSVGGNGAGDEDFRGDNLPVPRPWNGETGSFYGSEFPQPMDNQARRVDDGIDRVGKSDAEANEKARRRNEELAQSIAEFYRAEEEGKWLYERFRETAEATRRRYTEFARGAERLRKELERINRATDRLRATAERIREKLMNWLRPQKEEKQERPKSTWYDDPFDLMLKPPWE